MITDMVNLKIIGLKSDGKDLLEHIRDLGVLHIEEEKEYYQVTEEPLIEKMRFLRAGVLGLLEDLGWKDLDNPDWGLVESLREIVPLNDIAVLEEIEKSLMEFKERLSEMTDEVRALEESTVALKQVHYIATHFHSFFSEEKKNEKVVSLWLVDSSKLDNLLKGLERTIRSLTPVVERPYLNHKAISQGENFLVLALSVNPESSSAVSKLMEEFGCISYLVPKTAMDELALESPNASQMELKWLPKKLAQAKTTLDAAKREWGPRLAALYVILDEELELLVLEKKFSGGGELFTLNGWVPLSALEDTVSSLKHRFGERILATWRAPEPQEWPKVPILLKNSKWAKPFELFLKLLPMPGYKSIDPTALIAIFFPFFAGCMIGDIGYGIVFGLIGLWMFKKYRNRSAMMMNVSQILMNIAILSILWGFLYGEFFGDLGHRLIHLKPLWVERTEGIIPVMAFTIALGMAHILLGLALGAYEGVRHNKKRHVYERLGTLFTLLGILLFIVNHMDLVNLNFMWAALVFLVFGLAFLIKGRNLAGLIETIGSIGNILSYIRIAAIGLSSAILAMVATKFVDVLGVSFFGILLAFSIHLLNLIIAIAGSVLHSARLHYVEFFGKFYEGVGNKYKPLKRRRGTAWKKP